MKTSEKTIIDLCDRIDFLEQEVEYWKNKYKNEIKERAEEANISLQSAQKDMANALLFALSVRDDENGNLVLPADERSELAKNWKV